MNRYRYGDSESSAEGNLCYIKTYEEALMNERLREYEPQPWWFERPINYNIKGLGKSCGVQRFNLKDVVGITYDEYDEKNYTWLELFFNLHIHHQLPANRDEALQIIEKNKQSIFVYKVNGKYYIGDGHHRIIYAKFLKNNGTFECECISSTEG